MFKTVTIRNIIWPLWIRLSALAALLTMAALLLMLVYFGTPLIIDIGIADLFMQHWRPDHQMYGIMPMVSGTIWISTVAVIIAFPLSLGAAAFVSDLHSHARTAFMVSRVIRALSGVPTVVYGFIGMMVLVPLFRDLGLARTGFSVAGAGLVVAIMISPTMTLFMIDGFQQVPHRYRLSARALGAGSEDVFRWVVLPQAKTHIMAALVLGLGRAAGDTLIALMIAGNSVRTPDSVWDSARSLTAHIGLVLAADTDSPEFQSVFVCALLLVVYTSIVVGISRTIMSKKLPS